MIREVQIGWAWFGFGLAAVAENREFADTAFMLPYARAIEMGNGVVSRHRARRSNRGRPPSGAGVFHLGQGKDNLNTTLSASAVCKCPGLAVVDSLRL